MMKKPTAILVLAVLLVLCINRHASGVDINVCGKLKDNPDTNASVDAVAFSPDGTLLASANNVIVGLSPWVSKRSGQGGTSKGAVILWDVATKKKLDAIDCGGRVSGICISPTGKWLAATHLDDQGIQKVKVVELANRKERYSLSIDDKGLRSVSSTIFSPDGKKLLLGVTGPKFAELMIYDSESGKLQNTLKGGEANISCLSFSADGKLLTSISEDVVQIWDMTTEKERNSFSVGRGLLTAMSPDGATVAVATIGSRNYPGKFALTLHDAKTGKELIDFSQIRSAAALLFTPDRKYVISGPGGFIIIYDITTGKKLAVVDCPSYSGLAITSKGNMLATANYTGTVWLWEIDASK